MVSVKVVALAGVVSFATAAGAADMPPPYHHIPMPPIEEYAAAWYLRGDIGMTNQRFKGLDYIRFPQTADLEWLDRGGFDSGWTFGIGVGYQFNHWLRADVTGEYRGKTAFHALDRVLSVPQTNEYTASKSEWLALANVYADLGTWWNLTPFVGAGVGFSRNTIHHFRDINVPQNGVAFAETASKWNVAWALHAGLAYKVNPNLTFEFAYRYVSLGDAKTGPLTNYLGVTINEPMHFKNITSHDLRLGLRWMLDAGPAYHQPISLPPLMRRG